MKFGAQKYVKRLRSAPDGSLLTSAEKGVLRAIADDFRDELGFAFCSNARIVELTGRAPEAELEMTDGAEYLRQMDNAKRIVRRIVSALVAKGVLRRHAAAFERRGAQTSNEYELPGYEPAADVTRRQKARAKIKFPRKRVDGPMQRMCAAGAVQTQLEMSSPGGPDCPPSPGHVGPPLELYKEHESDLPISFGSFPQCANAEIAMPDIAKAKARATASARATATTSSTEAARVQAEGWGGAGMRSGRGARDPLAVMELDGEDAALEMEVARVMRECGFTEEPMRNTLRKVLELRVAATRCSMADAGDKAIRSWAMYCDQAPYMRYTVMPKKFFREGVWLTPKAWPFDGRRLEESGFRHPHAASRSF